MTDAEQALEDALEEGLPEATPLRDFDHLRQNCKSKLRALVISTPLQQKLFLDAVFGVQEERSRIIDAKDGKDLKNLLYSLCEFFNEEEAKFLKLMRRGIEATLDLHSLATLVNAAK
ncbi:hypothetical protein HOLleu_26916 [Holothuria leucospilota]|uniref:Uncharacterized protein n=1 Tax=Holothuria leucospilota TaxID=206669 RepID=A0A9Q1H1X5_HOLLE|nr:hypothetical protein HOLleu_26916 [Holothuria leucospilota]